MVVTAIQLIIFHEKYLKQFVWMIPSDGSAKSMNSSIQSTVNDDDTKSEKSKISPTTTVGQHLANLAQICIIFNFFLVA